MGNGTYRKINIDINGQTTLNVEDAATKFLGMELCISQSTKEKAEIARKALLQIINPLDEFPLPSRDKVQLYRNFALPKMRWVLLAQDLLPTALSNITTEIETASEEVVASSKVHIPRCLPPNHRDPIHLRPCPAIPVYQIFGCKSVF